VIFEVLVLANGGGILLIDDGQSAMKLQVVDMEFP
jgi:hypothetical protein